MSGDFHVLLMSNANMDRHPENTVSSFINVLKEPLTLDQNYEVALVEVHFTNSVYNVLKDHNLVNLRSFNKEGKEIPSLAMSLEIPPGLYRSRVELIRAMNTTLKPLNIGKFHIDPVTHMTSYTALDVPIDARTEITLSFALCIQLGYESDTIVNHTPLATRAADLTHNAPTHMLIYCDIVKYILVGDAHAPLLRMINTEYHKHEYGASITKGFLNLTYLPVARRVIDSISIDICNLLGQKLPFNSGRSSVLLHFRKRSPTQ
jgi:hypothetical protein